jgi:LmbE family N-acetylglucosaminyl deacetylase
VIPLTLAGGRERLSLLCIGAHSDDIEIGAGGLIRTLVRSGTPLSVQWCVLSAPGPRRAEATASAEAFLDGVSDRNLALADFSDAVFPSQSREIKSWLLDVRGRFPADVVLVHGREDAHQDHRELNGLAWNLFRDHLILEYEIPKWDGDLGRPNVYAPLTAAVVDEKVALLMRHFGTQRSKDWFDEETFRSLARIRGMECRASERYAEAFQARKVQLSWPA